MNVGLPIKSLHWAIKRDAHVVLLRAGEAEKACISHVLWVSAGSMELRFNCESPYFLTQGKILLNLFWNSLVCISWVVPLGDDVCSCTQEGLSKKLDPDDLVLPLMAPWDRQERKKKKKKDWLLKAEKKNRRKNISQPISQVFDCYPIVTSFLFFLSKIVSIFIKPSLPTKSGLPLLSLFYCLQSL